MSFHQFHFFKIFFVQFTRMQEAKQLNVHSDASDAGQRGWCCQVDLIEFKLMWGIKKNVKIVERNLENCNFAWVSRHEALLPMKSQILRLILNKLSNTGGPIKWLSSNILNDNVKWYVSNSSLLWKNLILCLTWAKSKKGTYSTVAKHYSNSVFLFYIEKGTELYHKMHIILLASMDWQLLNLFY